MSKKTRYIEIDIAKGILIFLVILGHSPIEKWLACGIGSFHMASFFCLSGQTYNFNGELKLFALKKIKSLIIPYILFSIILLGLATIKNIFHFGLDNYSLISGIESIFVPYHGRELTSVYCLWFLPCLFLVEISVAFSQYISRLCRNKIVLFLLLLSFSFTSIIIYQINHVASIISIYPIGLLFFVFGLLIKPLYLKNIIKKYFLVIAIISLVFFIYVVTKNMCGISYNLDLSSMYLGHWWLYLISCLLGCIFTLGLSKIINFSLLQQIGRDSLFYYGLHFCVIWIVNSFVGGVICAIVTIAITYPLIILYKKIYSYLPF